MAVHEAGGEDVAGKVVRLGGILTGARRGYGRDQAADEADVGGDRQIGSERHRSQATDFDAI